MPPPKYTVDRLVPCEIIPSTTVEELFIIERGDALDGGPRPVDAALDELIANTDDAYGFPPFRYLAPVLVVGGEDYAELRARERADPRHRAGAHPRAPVVSDRFGWADEIPHLLAADAPTATDDAERDESRTGARRDSRDASPTRTSTGSTRTAPAKTRPVP